MHRAETDYQLRDDRYDERRRSSMPEICNIYSPNVYSVTFARDTIRVHQTYRARTHGPGGHACAQSRERLTAYNLARTRLMIGASNRVS